VSTHNGQGQVVVVGGTSGIGLEVAKALSARGDSVVLTGRDASRAQAVAMEVGGRTKGLAVDVSKPREIAAALKDVCTVSHVVIAAIDRDENSARNYDIEGAIRLVTLKLVGYTEVIHTLLSRMSPNTSVVLFGGLAKERPYPGSTTVTTVNGGVSTMIRTLATELAPIRFNAIHPGIVGDSPAWSGKPPEILERVRTRTPTGRLPTMCDVACATMFLLDNRSINGVNLNIDGGWLLT
jgi:NAD(P)-dependent dehydrogenase (short-subunit alcohol dehydrogenase family)